MTMLNSVHILVSISLKGFFYFAQNLLLPSSILKGNMLNFVGSVLQKCLITRNGARYWKAHAPKNDN